MTLKHKYIEKQLTRLSGIEQNRQRAEENVRRIRQALLAHKGPAPRRGVVLKVLAAAAALVVLCCILYNFNGSVDLTAPAFGEVIDNVLRQKWIYMFQEDRETGRIDFEYWYNPQEQKIFSKGRSSDRVSMIDLLSGEAFQYQDNKLKISIVDDLESTTDWLSERLPAIGGFLERHEGQGANIVQKTATYNGKPAFLYEIETTFPDGRLGPFERFKTSQYIWLVDRKTHLPIICEHKYITGRQSDGKYKEGVGSSERHAFDYSDTGPADIYALGVPHDAEIVDERPSAELQQLIDNINSVKAQLYTSYAAIIVENDRPHYLVIRDGYRLREDNFELSINGSDYTPKQDYYIRQMGNSFDSIYQWLHRPDSIFHRQDTLLCDGRFSYRTNDWDIKKAAPPEIHAARRSIHSRYDQFQSHCWWSTPRGQVVRDDYAEANGLICTAADGYKYYYDPSHNFFRVRTVDPQGQVRYEISEFSTTPAGLLYPSVLRQAYGRRYEDRPETYLAGYTSYRIYACDLNDELAAKLDPKSLPNYIDHRELTREMIERRRAAADSNAPANVEYTGFTPLHMAIYREDVDKVKACLRDGGEVEPVGDTGATPMELAVAAGNLELVKLLYEHGADFISNDQEKRCCLGLAVENRSSDIVDYMLRLDTDVNALYKEGKTPLHYAAANGDASMVRTLISNGVAIDAIDQAGWTPLAEAIRYYAEKIFSTPAEPATIEAYRETIETLIAEGADINRPKSFRGRNEETILEHVTRIFGLDCRNTQQHLESLAFLLEMGANPNLMTEISSPLLIAIEETRFDIVKLLLGNGADPWLIPERYRGRPSGAYNLLYLARQMRNESLYDLLYPYMKERYESTNAELVQAAKVLMQALVRNDSAAMNDLCIPCPDRWAPSEEWMRQISETYRDNTQLIDKTVPGWFTTDGFADVFIPLPEGSQNKCIALSFLEVSEGVWKCVSYGQMTRLPGPDDTRVSGFLSVASYQFKEFADRMRKKFQTSPPNTSSPEQPSQPPPP